MSSDPKEAEPEPEPVIRSTTAEIDEWLAKRRRVLSDNPAQQVLHGDLRGTGLLRAFEEIAELGQEGTLRVHNRVDERYLYFRDGAVRIFAPNRTKNRLGEQLMHLGLLTEKQLDEALGLQKILYQPLGKILIDRQIVEADAIDRVAEYRAAEDLYSLFTWERGQYEFFTEERTDPEMAVRLQVMPVFALADVHQEVDRRAVKWRRVLKSLHSLDEVFTSCGGRGAENLAKTHHDVLLAMDGRRTVRELPEASILSLFDCARVVGQLNHRKLVKRLPAGGLIALAKQQAKAGDKKRAMLTLETLLDRQVDGLENPADAELVVALLQTCDSPKLTAEALVRAARLTQDPEDAEALAREACELDGRSIDALFCLQEQLLAADQQSDELFEVSSRLADTLAEDGRCEIALKVMDEVLGWYPDDIDSMHRKARVLHRLDRVDEAVACLATSGELLRANGENAKAVSVYRQIQKLDPSRKDVALILRELESNWLARHAVPVVAAVVVATLLLVGVTWYQGHRTERIEGEFVARIEQRLAAKDIPGAMAALNEAVAELGERERLATFRGRIQNALRTQKTLQNVGATRRDDKLRDARRLIVGGELRSGLEAFQALEDAGAVDAKAVRESLAKVVRERIALMETARDDLEERTQMSSDVLERMRQSEQLVEALAEWPHAAEVQLAKAALELREGPLLAAMLSEEDREQLLAVAQGLADVHARAEEIRGDHQTTKALDPLIAKALRHANDYEFEEALAAYQRLADEHPHEGEAKQHFREQVVRFEVIVGGLESLRGATARGDFESARAALAWLEEREPSIPFRGIVRLPLLVKSTPPGAAVLVNGADVGRTPALISFVPRGKLQVRLELDGFAKREFWFAPTRGVLEQALIKLPDWTFETKGSVEHQPVGDGRRVFLTDRSGRLTALDAGTGAELWTFSSGDFSGLLPTPILYGDSVIVGSVDGTMRSIARSSGTLRWERAGIACEGAPALVGPSVVAATNDGALVGLAADDGSVRYRVKLPGPVRTRVRAMGDSVVFATTNGYVVRARASDAKILWQARIGESVAVAPSVTSDLVIAASDDGGLVALRAVDGRPRWRHRELTSLIISPVVADSFVLVADESVLRAFRLGDGAPGPTHQGRERWSAAPVRHRGKIFIGGREGDVEVLDSKTLELCYLLHGPGASAPVVVSRDRVIAAFEGRQVQGFAKLP